MDFPKEFARELRKKINVAEMLNRLEFGGAAFWDVLARDALAAITGPLGCKVVGREPTDGMIDAGVHKWSVSGAENGTLQTFRAMFDAAPEFPGAGSVGTDAD